MCLTSLTKDRKASYGPKVLAGLALVGAHRYDGLAVLGTMRSKHVVEVLALYKRIMRLQQGLPKELQDLGKGYIRDEFKRHKGVGTDEAAVFLSEWAVSRLGLPYTAWPKEVNAFFSEICNATLRSAIPARHSPRRRGSALIRRRYSAYAR